MQSSIDLAYEYLCENLTVEPKTLIILGSGFAGWTHKLDIQQIIPYKNIPGFPQTTIKGHEGNLIVASFEEASALIMQGRFHYYEGYSMDTISIPIRTFSKLGVKTLIITNAAGSINHEYHPGELMLITDYLNHSLRQPSLTREKVTSFNPLIPDLQEIAKTIARQVGLTLHSGTYLYTTGPSYETPAEIRAMRILGADAVGMSTVPEILTAWDCGLAIVGISMISNYGAGIKEGALDHDEVIETMEKIQTQVDEFLMELTRKTLN